MKIAVAEGDGIGHEVVPVARHVLECFMPDADYSDVELGYGKWQRTGTACSDDDMDELRSADAILFGAITTPPSGEYGSVLLRIRHELDLYANIRPVKGERCDLVIVRENTEGLYSGIEWREKDRACTLRVVTEAGSRRIAKYACRLTEKRGGHLTVGNKANVMKSDVLFREVCLEEAAKAGIRCTPMLIDALALDILTRPERYDVIVTTNMFGDILSDMAGYLVGGLGLLPSANIGKEHAFFEPVHGSAPDIAGTNTANPIAAVRSAAMMLTHLGLENEAGLVETSIGNLLARGISTPDLGGTAGTDLFGDVLVQEIRTLMKETGA